MNHFLTLLALCLALASCQNESVTETTAWLDADALVAAYEADNPQHAEQALTYTGSAYVQPVGTGEIVVQTRDRDSGQTPAYVIQTSAGCEGCATDIDQARIVFLKEHLLVLDEKTGKSYYFSLNRSELPYPQLDGHSFSHQLTADGLAQYRTKYVEREDLLDKEKYTDALQSM